MNLQNFREVSPQLYAGKTKTADNMKRQPLNPGTKRMYPPEYHRAIYGAKTIGEVIKVMYKALSASGYNNFMDASPELAKKCLAKINEAKHNTQEI